MLRAGSKTPTNAAADDIRRAILDQGDDLLALFEAWDNNGNGVISRDEFLEGVHALGIPVSREGTLATFNHFDVDRTGTLSMRELQIQVDIIRSKLGDTQRVGAGAYEVLSLAYREAGLGCGPLTVEVTLMIAILLSGPVCVAFGLIYDAAMSADNVGWSVFAPDAKHLSKAVAHAVSAPVIATVLCLATAHHLGSDHGNRNAMACLCALCSRQSALIWAAVLSFQTYCATLTLVRVEYEPAVHYYFRLSYALVLFDGALSALHAADRVLHSFVTSDDEAFRTSQHRRTQLAIMKSVSHFGQSGVPAPADGAYSFKQHRSAADVLYQMWSVIRVASKVVACALMVSSQQLEPCTTTASLLTTHSSMGIVRLCTARVLTLRCRRFERRQP